MAKGWGKGIGKNIARNLRGDWGERALNFAISRSFIFAISMGENDKRSVNFAKALLASFYFQKNSLNYNLSKQTGTSQD